MDIPFDYKRMASELEMQELQSEGGIASPQVYGQLLAIYLLANDLSNAKLLWKRIPANMKNDNPELKAIWEIVKKLWHREFASIYVCLKEYEWPNHLNNVMNTVAETTRNRAITLISKGFTSITLSDMGSYLGLGVEETKEKVMSLGWTIDVDGYVIPVKIIPPVEDVGSIEENLGRLTEFVAFLEN